MPTRKLSAIWGRSVSVLGFILVVLMAVAAMGVIVVARGPLPGTNSQPAIAGAAAATASGSGPTSRPAATSTDVAIVEVPSAYAAAQKVLTDKYDVNCLSSGHVTYYRPNLTPERLDERIADANVDSKGWINEGKVWVGDPASAVDAFGAEAAFDDGDTLWIIRVTEKGPQARELFRIDSKSGKATWRMQDQVAECGSTDPASDDDEAAG